MTADVEAERVLLALAGRPRRRSGRDYWLPQPGTINGHDAARARGRALSRLAAAHRDEFERLWVEEQWRIARGEVD